MAFTINRKIVKVISNKYLIATIIFILLLLINDRNSIFEQIEYSRNLREIKETHQYYVSEIEKLRKTQTELFSNHKNLEKFAREKYLMKRDDEDIFVMMEE